MFGKSVKSLLLVWGVYYRLKSLLYLSVYFFAALPVLLIFGIGRFWILVHPPPKARAESQRIPSKFRRRVLVVGTLHTKGLHTVRILGRAGHTVILADAEQFRWNGTQFSKYVERFHTLPDDRKVGSGVSTVNILSKSSI